MVSIAVIKLRRGQNIEFHFVKIILKNTRGRSLIIKVFLKPIYPNHLAVHSFIH